MCQKSKENIYFPRSYEQKEFEKNIRVMGFLGRKKIRKIWELYVYARKSMTIKGPKIQMKILEDEGEKGVLFLGVIQFFEKIPRK